MHSKRSTLNSYLKSSASCRVDLLAVKAEKVHDFHYLTQLNQQKKLAAEKQKEMIELQKMEEILSKKS